MGDPTGFMKYPRTEVVKRPVDKRIKDWREFEETQPEEELRRQGARCMDCGVPFCHSGCPLGNVIPDWNDLVYRNRDQTAIEALHATNNFPEITGRICPAPCEAACVLGITDPPVSIKQIEHFIADRAFERGWITPEPPPFRTGKRVAVVGSGPSGLAAAAQLNRLGHTVSVYERAEKIGGLLRYGIPDFKLEKSIIDRRVSLMEAEGISFHPGVEIGVDLAAEYLLKEYNAVLLAGGSTRPRDLAIPGRDLPGIHFAMQFLAQQNRRLSGEPFAEEPILATGKRVVVIGGGDTGSDCVGTSIRQGARSVTQIELLPRPPEDRSPETPWPLWPNQLRTSSSHEEGCDRLWSIATKSFAGVKAVGQMHCVKLEWQRDGQGRWRSSEIPGSEFTLDADLVLLAMGFLGPEPDGVVAKFGVQLDGRGNVAVASGRFGTSVTGVFSAGDMRRGQSLVVWAIAEGRQAAREINRYLLAQ